ncbi:hypothetical protein LC087_07475 [Bacillus carboniphilus]|uniref:Uncharacterized protein n=1 Tax=Bacillus carboniphilus TaxID=86663 RepID=A0ABY9JX24_9BACI|nr:hypothetical protein [Bacillus carboniphilus]WLR43941.1 hypothetical protein LC087_07475 [Bacillus carboniphilus]
MIKSKLVSYILIAVFISVITTMLLINQTRVKESIIFFPLSSEVIFSKAYTAIDEITQTNNEYLLQWEIYSETSEDVFLRQDVSLLFENGKLVDVFFDWEEHSSKLNQSKKIKGEDSSHYTSITFHYGEIHLEDNSIKSVQTMSSDQLYVIHSPFSDIQSFKSPRTDEEKEWQTILDRISNQQQEYQWKRLIEHFKINEEKYNKQSLTSIYQLNNQSLEHYSLEETQKILGHLWEGLYKNYVLGLKKQDDSIEGPIGSSVPLILFAKDHSHLQILIQGKSGEKYQFIQSLN